MEGCVHYIHALLKRTEPEEVGQHTLTDSHSKTKSPFQTLLRKELTDGVIGPISIKIPSNLNRSFARSG